MDEIDVRELMCKECADYDVSIGFCFSKGRQCQFVSSEECTYKQLQQLKQENEKLKEEIKSLKQSLEEISKTDYFINENEKLEQKLEKIKEYINEYAGLYFDEVAGDEMMKILEDKQ